MRQCKSEGYMVTHPIYSCITIKINELHDRKHYHLAGDAHNHLTLQLNTGCSLYKVYSMTYHQNGCHRHHRREIGYLGEKSSTWRENGTCIYAKHRNTYIVLMKILSVAGDMLHHHRGDKKLSIC